MRDIMCQVTLIRRAQDLADVLAESRAPMPLEAVQSYRTEGAVAGGAVMAVWLAFGGEASNEAVRAIVKLTHALGSAGYAFPSVSFGGVLVDGEVSVAEAPPWRDV